MVKGQANVDSECGRFFPRLTAEGLLEAAMGNGIGYCVYLESEILVQLWGHRVIRGTYHHVLMYSSALGEDFCTVQTIYSGNFLSWVG